MGHSRLWRFVLAGILLVGVGTVARAQPAAPPEDAAKVLQFLDLLADPAVRTFLEHRTRDPAEPPRPEPPRTMASGLEGELGEFRAHIADLARSARDLPGDVQEAQGMARDALAGRDLWRTAFALAAFVGLGYAAQALYSLLGRPFRRRLLATRLDTVDERLKTVFTRLVYGLGLMVSYGLGSIGAFLLFEWPTLIKRVLLATLIAFLLVRLAAVVGRFLLAPGADRFRVVPISTVAAWFFYRRILVAAVLVGFGWQTTGILADFGFPPAAQLLAGDALGLVLIGIGVETLWRMPALGEAPTLPGMPERHRHRALASAVTVLLVLLWGFWVTGAENLFRLLAFGLAMPLAIVVARASVNHILRPTQHGDEPAETLPVHAVIFERGVRSIILVSGALLLAWTYDLDVVSLTMRDTIGTRILRGFVGVVVIALAADFLWTLIRAVIDRKLTRPLPHASSGADLGHAARLQTLLPIIRNMLLATIVIVAGMMMLAALGVQIGPLIASAGVVGVAIGFGAQTLVKDVISGIFYLVDDAFRIGEYIQSGTYKGTVESFSLRSVKLRHQRGALYTVPFGVLGAVQNQSRDWVVDKIVMNIPYGTDLDKVRKLIKRIGESLQEDPEFGPEILTPLKMQGVVQFGDYAIQIQTKMMTKPGDVQFMARRRALLMIKQAFEANGIGFAVPTVQVSGDSVPAGVAAQGLAVANATRVAVE